MRLMAVAVVLVAWSHSWPVVKAAEPDPSGPGVEHITIMAIECNLGAMPLKAQVLHRRWFSSSPIPDAQVKRLKWAGYDVRPVEVDSKGRFQANIVGEEDILVSAPGCLDQIVRVSQQTRTIRIT